MTSSRDVEADLRDRLARDAKGYVLLLRRTLTTPDAAVDELARRSFGRAERVGAITRPCLRDLRVFVEEAAEPVMAGDPEVSAGACVGKRSQWRGLAEGTVGTMLEGA